MHLEMVNKKKRKRKKRKKKKISVSFDYVSFFSLYGHHLYSTERGRKRYAFCV